MKFKLAVTTFAAAVIILSIYAIMRPSYDLGLIIDLGQSAAQIRIAIALLVLAYVWIPAVRLKVSQLTIFVGGATLLVLGVAGIFSPTLFGHAANYTELGDVMMAIEGGTIGLIAALQLETRSMQLRKTYLAPSYHHLSRLSLRPRAILSSHTRSA